MQQSSSHNRKNLVFYERSYRCTHDASETRNSCLIHLALSKVNITRDIVTILSRVNSAAALRALSLNPRRQPREQTQKIAKSSRLLNAPAFIFTHTPARHSTERVFPALERTKIFAMARRDRYRPCRSSLSLSSTLIRAYIHCRRMNTYT